MTVEHPSLPVCSKQHAVHPRLGAVLEAHLARAYQAPLHQPTEQAFRALQCDITWVTDSLVFDSGCGTGESTRLIARAMPDCLVVGIDKSAARLARTGARRFPHREGNAVWLRGDLPTIWRLALEAGWRLRAHYLLYPNPWPKARHLRRRWHGHPVFPQILALGGRLEMRCNWTVYAEEFALAASRLLGRQVRVGPVGNTAITSPFERKYRASGHGLYSVVVATQGNGV